MKRIFTIITILITLSLVGIIFFQVSWLKNMVLLREEQIKEKIDEAVDLVGHELEPYKGNYSPGPIGKDNIFPVKARAVGFIYAKLDVEICRTCPVQIFRECKTSLPNGEAREMMRPVTAASL